jgi:hypothetical protein
VCGERIRGTHNLSISSELNGVSTLVGFGADDLATVSFATGCCKRLRSATATGTIFPVVNELSRWHDCYANFFLHQQPEGRNEQL